MLNVCIGASLNDVGKSATGCLSSGGSTTPTSPVSQLKALLHVALHQPSKSVYDEDEIQDASKCIETTEDHMKNKLLWSDSKVTTGPDLSHQTQTESTPGPFEYNFGDAQHNLFQMGYFGSADETSLVSAMLSSTVYGQNGDQQLAILPTGSTESNTSHSNVHLEHLLLAQGLINNTSSLMHQFFRQPLAFAPESTTGVPQHKAVAFLAGPRERIHVMGNPVEFCPRCRSGGVANATWRPHRHIGELKIRYICERHFDDLESPHHFDIPLCPVCNQVLYIYEFNAMLGVSNARRLHKYVLKCCNRHVLPLLDLLCQTKKGGDRCNANFKLQWCYGTMVKRCESQKNRDHDLWWVRYKNEWKQRRTIIRYKKDFLSHLSESQRGLLLGLGLEGEPPPEPEAALGPTFDILLSSSGSLPQGLKLRKRPADRLSLGACEMMSDRLGNLEHQVKRRQRLTDGSYGASFTDSMYYAQPSPYNEADHVNWASHDLSIVTGTPTTACQRGTQPPVAASVIGVTVGQSVDPYVHQATDETSMSNETTFAKDSPESTFDQ